MAMKVIERYIAMQDMDSRTTIHNKQFAKYKVNLSCEFPECSVLQRHMEQERHRQGNTQRAPYRWDARPELNLLLIKRLSL